MEQLPSLRLVHSRDTTWRIGTAATKSSASSKTSDSSPSASRAFIWAEKLHRLRRHDPAAAETVEALTESLLVGHGDQDRSRDDELFFAACAAVGQLVSELEASDQDVAVQWAIDLGDRMARALRSRQAQK